MNQQSPFDSQAPTISGQRPVGANHPVAWDNDGNWIGRIGMSNSTAELLVSKSQGKIPIGDCLPIRDSQKFIPHLLLEGGSLRLYLQLETAAPPVKVFLQLSSDAAAGSEVPFHCIVFVRTSGRCLFNCLLV